MGRPLCIIKQYIRSSRYHVHIYELTKVPKPSVPLIHRWSRPKRDPVDEIIVQESKREELMWTDYHTEETEIKNQITELILDDLLADTVAVFKKLLC